ncbi:MAG: hypothetical protein KME18_00040 [Phormidium tanganyikae FI6-MK23]|nr:hypothetical protein [Phormidium tanganyikae FI6-MK23]
MQAIGLLVLEVRPLLRLLRHRIVNGVLLETGDRYRIVNGVLLEAGDR